MPKDFRHLSKGNIIDYCGSAFIVSHSQHNFIHAVSLSQQENKITLTLLDRIPAKIAENALDYVKTNLDRIF